MCITTTTRLSPSTGEHESDDRSGSDLGQESDLGPALARVVHVEGCEVTLTGSHLTPSRPGFAGDRGHVADVAVLDVEEQADGLVHVLEHPLHLVAGQVVEVHLDVDRRDRLARTHAACVLVRSQLAARSIRVTSVEITAGLCWLEIDEPAHEFDLSRLLARELSLEPRPLGGGRMLVDCGGVSVDTALAPIARSSRAVAGAEVRTVAALEGGRAALEIALPDGRGRWWR
jgi:hypothetical protein